MDESSAGPAGAAGDGERVGETAPAGDAPGVLPDERPPAESPDPGWTWPPAGPTAHVGTAWFATEEWAPPSTVRHPVVRVGSWTLLYRRAAPRRRARALTAHLTAFLVPHLPVHLGAGRLRARLVARRDDLRGRGIGRRARRR